MNEVKYLLEVYRKGGPEPYEFDDVANAYRAITASAKKGELSKEDLEQIEKDLGKLLTVDTCQGFIKQKPYGYAGDFELIDRIYNRYTSPDKHLARWDNFAHSCKSNQAVRNRKAYFIRLIENLLKTVQHNRDISVLNVGSGPARDVKEFLDTHYHPNLTFDCLDMEQRAITYAKDVCARHLDQVNFISANVFRFNPEHKYSLVWSAGLFDYLDDKAFKFLLQRMCTFTERGGELIVGNFSPVNPDIEIMEFLDWKLNYRTTDDLYKLVEDAGIISESMTVESEEEGVNLFLRIKSPYLKTKEKQKQDVVVEKREVSSLVKEIKEN